MVYSKKKISGHVASGLLYYYLDSECGRSCLYARKHLAVGKEKEKSTVHVCCQLFKIGQLPQTVKTYSSLNTYESL